MEKTKERGSEHDKTHVGLLFVAKDGLDHLRIVCRMFISGGGSPRSSYRILGSLHGSGCGPFCVTSLSKRQKAGGTLAERILDRATLVDALCVVLECGWQQCIYAMDISCNGMDRFGGLDVCKVRGITQ